MSTRKKIITRHDTSFNHARLGRLLAEHRKNRCRIVLTGGPGGGKTTAADLFRRELGERVVIVPEAATLLFSGGFPRSSHPQLPSAGVGRGATGDLSGAAASRRGAIRALS